MWKYGKYDGVDSRAVRAMADVLEAYDDYIKCANALYTVMMKSCENGCDDDEWNDAVALYERISGIDKCPGTKS